MIEPSASCPCGSEDRFDGCCGPVLGGVPAANPEALMRSRYTAFAVGDVVHLRETWHPGTRPEDIAIDPETRWIGLRILDVDRGGDGDTRGVVEFEARYRERGDEGVLHERSRFVRQSDRWWYLDGQVR